MENKAEVVRASQLTLGCIFSEWNRGIKYKVVSYVRAWDNGRRGDRIGLLCTPSRNSLYKGRSFVIGIKSNQFVTLWEKR